MANRFNIVGNIYSSSQLPDLDFKYGPFSSTEEAFEFLGPDEEDIACVGLTVGIQEDPDGPIVEYWFKDACESADDLVPKGAEVPSGTVIDPDYVHTDNNYTDEEKTKLEGLENYDDTEILAALDDKVDKEDGKVLSSNDFTTAEKTKLASVEENAQENIIEEVKVNNTALTPDENKSINISVPEVLEDLDNINVTSATDGQVLAYDATNDEWVNETIVVDKALDDLTDVTVTSASDRQTLIYDDTNDEWVNGTLNTSDLTNDSGFIDNTVDDLVNYYDKTEIDSKVASVYKYKGSVNTYADLPSTGQVVGDVYNIATADKTHHIKAGDNVAWNGTEWDVLAGEIDLTDYYTSSEVDDLLDEKISEPATEGTNGQVLTTDGNGGRTWTTVNVDKDLGDLGDVAITDPIDGQILKYDATNEEWINQTLQIHNIQVETLPTASSSEEGNIYQYVGTTTGDYVNGHFYKCVSDGESTPTYSWKNIDVIDKSVTYSETIPETSDYEEGDVVVYTGSDTDFFKNGHAYKKIVLQDNKFWDVSVKIDSTGRTFNNSFRRDGQTLDLKPNLILYEINGDFRKHILVREVTSEISFKGTYLTSNGTFYQKGDTAVFSSIREPSGGVPKTWEDWEEISTQRVFLPVASADELGNIYQYIGSYDSNYTSGHFYKCVSNGEDPATYSWEEVKYSTVSALDDLTNVDITTPTDGQILKYDATNEEWVNDDLVISVSDLDGVDIDSTSIADGQIIKYNATSGKWENANVDISTSNLEDLGNVNVTTPTEGDIITYDSTNSEWVNIPNTDVGQIIQVSTLPTASIDELDKIYQYIGATTSTLTNGYFYKCVSDGESTPTYSWENIQVQEGTSGSQTLSGLDDVNITNPTNDQILKYDAVNEIWVNGTGGEGQTIQVEELPTASADELGNIYQYVGETGTYTKGYFYECVSDGEDPATYSWENIKVQQGGSGSQTLAGLDDVDINCIEWSIKTWSGLTNFRGNYIWSDGENVYYSRNENQYILDKSTSTWSPKTWTGLTNFDGEGIWSDNENVYYSSGTQHYVLNKSTSTWFIKTWTGLTEFYGGAIWSDGDNIYYSAGSNQYVLDKSTSSWSPKTWLGLSQTDLTNFRGNYIWSDGNNFYYSYLYGDVKCQYVLDKSTSTWSPKTWTGLTEFWGIYIWTDSVNIYYSGGIYQQFVLNKSTSTWSPKTWSGRSSSEFYANNVWTDGDNIYFSRDTQHYKLNHTDEALIYDWTNQKWINKEIISKEDIPKTFTGTQAEWDALTTDKKLTYKQVNITDDESGANLDYYSTAETKTNKVWIDGKPIYRKVIDCGALPNNDSKNVAHNISTLYDVITIKGVAKFDNGNHKQYLPAPYVANTLSANDWIYLSADKNSIVIKTWFNFTGYNFVVVIEYTKTTD